MSDERTSAASLRAWLHGPGTKAHRWMALDDCCSAAQGKAQLKLQLRLASIIERSEVWPLKLRRRAAVALLRLCSAGAPPDSARLQQAMARSLALALPRDLATPRVVPLLEPDECASLIDEARAHGRAHGWQSLHRKYSTVDMPVSLLPSGEQLERLLRLRALPLFAKLFGEQYGPASSLEFVHGSGLPGLFVVRYACGAAEHAQQGVSQRGLAGHVDESICSLVLTLSEASEYSGGGTRFERSSPPVLKPDRGSAVLFLGKCWHEGVAITSGERFVLVGLVNRRPNARGYAATGTVPVPTGT